MLTFWTLCQESAYLTLKIPPLLLRYLFDSLFAPVLSRPTPHNLLQNEVHGTITECVESTPEQVGGAGGHGTERLCHTIHTSEKIILSTFMKTRTNQFFESFFLNLFGVYANEISFYQYLKKSSTFSPLSMLPDKFFPEVYVAKFSMFSSNFTLILEDVTKTRVLEGSKVSFPCLEASQEHPLVRVEAVLRAQALLHSTFCNRAPDSVWGGKQSPAPRFLQVIALSTLRDVETRFPGVMSPSVLNTYRLFLDNFSVVRSYWSNKHSQPKESRITLVHGDSHVGNYFFEEERKNDTLKCTARMYDFQCVACEHPMRDVVYHVMSSVSDEVVDVAGGDKELIRYYLQIFNENLLSVNPSVPAMDLEEAWYQYRLHACWVLTAWIISAGAGDKLFESEKAKFILAKISRACERVDVHQALVTFLRKEGIEC